MIYLLLVLAVLVYVVHQVITNALPRFFLVPSQHWQDKVQKVMDFSKPIYLKVGYKRSSYRRRLITSSKYPEYYNNFNNNKLKIHPDDCKNEDGYFTDGFKHRKIEDPQRKILYGFFHPYANNGGGGERVLWQAVYATLIANDRNIAIIYTVNMEEPVHIINKAKEKFNIDIDATRVVFIYLRKFSKMIDNNYWKHFTLAGQLFGSMMLSLEAMFEVSPDIWVDTIGLPGSYFLVRLILKIPILAYVHYPVLQQDMFNKLKFSSAKDLIKFRPSLDDVKSVVKFLYWDILYYTYVYLGSQVDITLTNGTWTNNHMKKIWFINRGIGSLLETLYPPCNTEAIEMPDTTIERENKIIYIAQFRPEKRHDLVLQQYSEFLKLFKASKQPIKNLPTLLFLGSCRTADDTATLESIKQLVTELDLVSYVEFIIDCSYSEIQFQLSKVKFGLNSMWNEHFGIGVVEYLAAGVIPISHASAGPLLDIALNYGGEPVTSWRSDSGFFFKSTTDPDFDPSLQDKDTFKYTFNGTDYEFAKLKFSQDDEVVNYPELSTLLAQLYMFEPELISKDALNNMQQTGYNLVHERFSNKKFTKDWIDCTRNLLTLEKAYREDKRTGIESVH